MKKEKSELNNINVSNPHPSESGFALVAALIILVLLGVISATALAFSSTEAQVANNDLKRTETFYAAEAKLEEMSNKFNNLFLTSVVPDPATLNGIADNTSLDLMNALNNKYSFAPFTPHLTSLQLDENRKQQLEATFGAGNPFFVSINGGPYNGMNATLTPYVGRATAVHSPTGSSVTLERQFNNYLIPIFQFSLFSDGDIELDPGAPMSVSGRVHANGNVYAIQNLLFTGNITTAGELVRGMTRSGKANTAARRFHVDMKVRGNSSCPWDSLNEINICTIPMLVGGSTPLSGSVENGPNLSTATQPQDRGFWPGSPDGSPTSHQIGGRDWDSYSKDEPSNGDISKFNNQVLTRSNYGVQPLELPLGLDDVSPVELIKRKLPDVDTPNITKARYDNKAQIRIIIDDEDASATYPSNRAGIPAVGTPGNGGGVNLSSFTPITLCTGDCTPLRRFNQYGGYHGSIIPEQRDPLDGVVRARTVRGIKRSSDRNSSNDYVPGGSGIKGHILIEIVKNGVATDVTTEVLSMGMTVGEPNAIVMLQRPLWAAFMQGSWNRHGGWGGGNEYPVALSTLFSLQNENGFIYDAYGDGGESDGQIKELYSGGHLDSTLGYISGMVHPNLHEADNGIREEMPAALPTLPITSYPINLNAIVPINVYNVREGWISNAQDERYVYKRGVTSVVDINMYNLVRWLDGRFDGILLSEAGVRAKRANIGVDRGYVLYISDRRGDHVKNQTTNNRLGNQPITSSDGNVDNENVYFRPTPPLNTSGPTIPASDVITDSVFVNKDGFTRDLTPRNGFVELPDNLVQPTNSATSDWDHSTPTVSMTLEERLTRAIKVLSWHNDGSDQQLTSVFPDRENYFRRAVRLSNGENLTTSCTQSTAPNNVVTWTCDNNRLNATKGLTIASENMVYIWGSYNTTGVGGFSEESSINDGQMKNFQGPQIPASIICDAFFPLSKTWYDASSAMFPEGSSNGNNPYGGSFTFYRVADDNLLNFFSPWGGDSSGLYKKTAVRAAVMFGTTNSALAVSAGEPARATDSSGKGIISSGGMHNAPRFLEQWSRSDNYGEPNEVSPWSFSGSMVTLYTSTQAFAPWENTRAVTYTPPRRNWGFDVRFTDPNKLPPGTPYFQYVQSAGFQQIIGN